MKKFKKILSICLTAIMVISSISFSVSASSDDEPVLQFVELDENGEIIEIVDAVYIQEVADAYEQRKMFRWPLTQFYNLGSGAYSISGGSCLMAFAPVHFYPNSSGRLYYDCEVTGRNAALNIYDVTNERYYGSFHLVDQGNGIYSRNGYVTGLSTSNYYSYGIASLTTDNINSFNASVSWNSL